MGLLLPHILVASGGGDHMAGSGMPLGSQGWFSTHVCVEPEAILSPQRF